MLPPDPFPIWFVVALKNEWVHLKRKYKFERISGPDVFFRIQDCKNIFLLQVGPGEVAKKNFSQALKNSTPKTIIHFGSCGALKKLFACGDVLFPEMILNTMSEKIKITTFLTKETSSSIFPFSTGILITSPVVLAQTQEKINTQIKFDADIVDMESFYLAKICTEKNINYIPIRVVFDELDDNLENIGEPYSSSGDLAIGKLAKTFMTHPKIWLQIPILQRKAKKVNDKIEKVVSCIISSSSL